MKKFLVANQYQRQQQEKMEKGQELKSSNLDSPGSSQTTSCEKNDDSTAVAVSASSVMSSLPLPSHLELLSGVPPISDIIKPQKSIPSLVDPEYGPDSPPDAMDLINMGHSTSSEKTTESSSSDTNKTILPVATTPTSNINNSMPSIDNDTIGSFSEKQNRQYTITEGNENGVGNTPRPFSSSKPLSGQQRNVVLERRVDVEETSSSNFPLANPVICATKSVPISSCDDITKVIPQVPNIENINNSSVHSMSNHTSETTEATTSTFSSISNNKPLSNAVGQISGAKNPYLMKKQSFIDNQQIDFTTNRDLNKSDNSISSEHTIKVTTQETPSTNTSIDSSVTPMRQAALGVKEGQQTSATIPVKQSVVPLEKEHKPLQQKRESPILVPLSKSPEGSPSNSRNKQGTNKPKEELTKEEREEQRRRRIHAFSEYQKRLNEERAKKDEERKLEQEKRRQEEIALTEQRKRLKSVRIPKRNKEFSPLVSPNPSSPIDPLIKTPEGHHISGV